MWDEKKNMWGEKKNFFERIALINCWCIEFWSNWMDEKPLRIFKNNFKQFIRELLKRFQDFLDVVIPS